MCDVIRLCLCFVLTNSSLCKSFLFCFRSLQSCRLRSWKMRLVWWWYLRVVLILTSMRISPAGLKQITNFHPAVPCDHIGGAKKDQQLKERGKIDSSRSRNLSGGSLGRWHPVPFISASKRAEGTQSAFDHCCCCHRRKQFCHNFHCLSFTHAFSPRTTHMDHSSSGGYNCCWWWW